MRRFAALALLVGFFVTAQQVCSQDLALLSVNDSGVQGNNHSGHLISEDVGAPAAWWSLNGTSVSYNGRYVVFSSEASNLVPNDTNGVRDVFIRDRVTNKTVRVSVGSAGTQANAASGLYRFATNDWLLADCVAICANGRFVAFSSFASNLTSDSDPEGQTDIFVHDRDANQNGIFDEPGGIATRRISDGGTAHHRWVSISADGSRAAYVSRRSDNWTRYRVVNTNDGSEVVSSGYYPLYYSKAGLSGTGNYLGIVSRANDGTVSYAIRDLTGGLPQYPWLVTGSVPTLSPLSIHLSHTGEEWVVSQYDTQIGIPTSWGAFRTGTQQNGLWQVSLTSSMYGWNATIGPEGRFLSLETTAQLHSSDTDSFRDVYLVDCDPDGDGNFVNAREFYRISRPQSGNPNDGSRAGALARDAMFVAFESAASNLVPGDANGKSDVFGTGSTALDDIWVELCILVDASGSMDSGEYRTVLEAYADAVRDSTIVPRNAQIAINLVLFSDTTETVIPWTLVNSAATANALGDMLQCYADNQPTGCPRPFNGATDIAAGLIGAAATFVSNNYIGSSQIINVTGDGVQNVGSNYEQLLQDARDNVLDFSVQQINALAYTIEVQNLDLYFESNLIGGTARNLPAFVLTAPDIQSVPATVVQKLRREICLADLNRDGVVNTVDFVMWFNLYNAADPITDVNGDGLINSLDFIIWNNAWSAGCN